MRRCSERIISWSDSPHLLSHFSIDNRRVETLVTLKLFSLNHFHVHTGVFAVFYLLKLIQYLSIFTNQTDSVESVA